MKRMLSVAAVVGLVWLAGCGDSTVSLNDDEAALVGSWVQESLSFFDANGVVTEQQSASYYGIDCRWVLSADLTFERRRTRNGEFFQLLKGTWSTSGAVITFVFTEGATGDASMQFSRGDSDHWFLVNNQQEGPHWEGYVRQ